MFWSKTDREARRQKVLDELLEVDAADRRNRIEQAVVAGDVRAGEVEQALRLVDRLDALRVMTIPHVHGDIRSAHASDLEDVTRPDDLESMADAEDVATESSASVEEALPLAARMPKSKGRRAIARKGSKPRVGAAGHTPRGRSSRARTAIPVVREPEAISIEPEMIVPAPDEPQARVAVDPQILAAPMPMDALEAAARLIARDLSARKAARSSAVPRRHGHRPGNDVERSPEPTLTAAGGRPAEPVGPSIDWLRP